MAEHLDGTAASTSSPMPGPDRLLDRSAVSLHGALASGELSAREVTQAALDAAHAKQDLGAFVHLDPDAALAQAAALDDARATGAEPASLHGMPVAWKDLVDVAGMPTRYGSAAFSAAGPAAQDDPLVARLRHAGTVVLGKTTVPEFGLDSYSENRVSAPARTPLDPTRTAGGSTGGGAAAVAAGVLPFSPGSDGGGSLRIPAAACGLLSLKPGRGTVPTDRSVDSVRTLVVSGPIAHTAEDAALLLETMTSPEGLPGRLVEDVRRVRARREAGERPTSLRIGLTTASPFSPAVEIALARPALAALTRAGALLEAAGHAVDSFSPWYGEDYHRDFRTVWTSGLLDRPLPEGAERHLGSVATSFLASARATGPQERAAAVERLEGWARAVRAQFAEQDVVLTPVLATPPPPVGHFLAMEPEVNYAAQCAFTPYTSMVNVMGLPAVTVPLLRDEAGLSWSVQLVGRPGTEGPLLGLATDLELLLAA
ncbi:amidase [Micrococcus sp.]|uniref:amidase n=1 Tax=Micrococcus sp. TaxID=1271 RepID=UPI002A911C75|nr:amidase [Micrococcus sp.]MDY6054673.1 amidase [Micrococcus sp.]